MPDRRKHRGPNPLDANLFAPEWHDRLRAATSDLSWLLTRGYTMPSAIKAVGDRYNLDARQRTAVQRSACSDESLRHRAEHRATDAELNNKPILLDGYNVLTTVEAGLAGGVLIRGRDGALRDLASMHGTWRKVEETTTAIGLIGQTLTSLRVSQATWLLDSPVSNSGRLKQLIEAVAITHQWNWKVELVPNPDKVLIQSTDLIATADSVILDANVRWFPVAERTVSHHVAGAWLVEMGSVPSSFE